MVVRFNCQLDTDGIGWEEIINGLSRYCWIISMSVKDGLDNVH